MVKIVFWQGIKFQIILRKICMKRKLFKAALALAITTNFVNEGKVEEIRLREFGLAYQYHMKWFRE